MISAGFSRLLLHRARAHFVVRLALAAGCSSSSSSSTPSSLPPISTNQSRTKYKSVKKSSHGTAKPEWSKREGDLILMEIRKADNSIEMFKIIEQYHEVMNNKHLIICLESLFKMVKEGNTTPERITNSPEFEILSTRIRKRMSFYAVEDFLEVLKIASQFKVSPTSSLVQGVCENIQTSMNRFTLTNLMFLHFLLARFKEKFGTPTPIMEALNTALPIIFHQKCTPLNASDHHVTFKVLRFATQARLNEKTLEMLSSKLKSYCNNLSSLQAANLLVDVAKMDDDLRKNVLEGSSPSSLREVVQLCSDVVTANLHKFYNDEVFVLLSTLPVLEFSEPLYDTLWRIAAENKWNLTQVATLAYFSRRMQYFTMESGKLVRDCIIENENEMLINDQHSGGALARFVALLASHSRFLGLQASDTKDEDALTQKAGWIIATSREGSSFASGHWAFSKFMRDLAIAGVFPKEQLEILFSKAFEEDLLSSSNINPRTLRNLVVVEQLVTVNLGKDSTEFRLSPALRSEALRAIDCLNVDCRPVKMQLATALGGSQFIAEGIITPLGTRVDLLIAMRPGDYPIAISDDGNTNDDVLQTLPMDSKVVAIIIQKETSYLHGSGLPVIDVLAQVELLRAQRMCPLVVNADKWMDLRYHEKVPHIMRDIKATLALGQVYEVLKDDANAI